MPKNLEPHIKIKKTIKNLIVKLWTTYLPKEAFKDNCLLNHLMLNADGFVEDIVEFGQDLENEYKPLLVRNWFRVGEDYICNSPIGKATIKYNKDAKHYYSEIVSPFNKEIIYNVEPSSFLTVIQYRTELQLYSLEKEVASHHFEKEK